MGDKWQLENYFIYKSEEYQFLHGLVTASKRKQELIRNCGCNGFSSYFLRLVFWKIRWIHLLAMLSISSQSNFFKANTENWSFVIFLFTWHITFTNKHTFGHIFHILYISFISNFLLCLSGLQSDSNIQTQQNSICINTASRINHNKIFTA